MTVLEALDPPSNDHRELPPLETSERILDPIDAKAVDNVLIIGAAAQHVKSALYYRWLDRFTIHDQPIHEAGLDVLQLAAMAGMEHHLQGSEPRDETAHHLRAYDLLFAGSAIDSHIEFLDNLSVVSQTTGNLINFADFDPADEQVNLYFEIQAGLLHGADTVFDKLFFEAQEFFPEQPGAYPAVLKELDPEVIVAYLEKSRLAKQLLHATRHRDFVELERCKQKFRWRFYAQDIIYQQLGNS